MSTVTKLDCVICNPEQGDVKGIRRPVTVTSQELSTLILHVITEHTPKPEFAPTEINKALDEIAPVVTSVNVAPVKSIADPAGVLEGAKFGQPIVPSGVVEGN